MKKLFVKLNFLGILLISPFFVMPNPIPVYSVQFEVQNQLQQPISDATITFGSITHPPGDYNFMIEDPGTYPYTVVREGYQTAVGTVIIIEYSFDPIIVNVTLIAECAFIIHDATGPAGEDILIDVEIINIGFQIVAFQADIILPEGFGYVPGSAFLNPLRSAGHLFNANVLPGTNTLRMIAFSLTNTAFNGNSGNIASFTLTTPDIPGTYMLTPVVILGCPYPIVVPGTVILTPIDIFPGDANCDGAVNVLDVTTTISYILGNNPQPFCFENADINGDGTVNVIDVVGTISIILQAE